MAKVTRVERTVPAVKKKKKVAAYASISMESERMNHSLSAQISYYSSLIQKNPDWEYAGVFADDGISGTGIAKRDEFRRMIAAAENGEIDVILTKSIQRFARNTFQTQSLKSEKRTMGSCHSIMWRIRILPSLIKRHSIMCRKKLQDARNWERWRTRA